MRTQHYEPKDPGLDGNPCLMHLGTGLANTLAYLSCGFRDWHFYGFVPADKDCHFALDVQGYLLLPVYGQGRAEAVHSDHAEKEKRQIAEGKTSILLFKGTDNYSVMRRMRPEIFDRLVLTRFTPHPNDLFYNS